MSEPGEAISGAVRQIVADYALDQESLHASWRCGYPDIYGPCNCVDGFVADAVKTLAAHMADREAEAQAQVLEEAADQLAETTNLSVVVAGLRKRAMELRLTPDTEGETQHG